MANIPAAPTFAQTDTEALPTPFDRGDKTLPAQAIARAGKIASEVGQFAMSALQKSVDQADATAVQEAETQYNQEIQSRLYGTPPTQDSEYSTRLNAGLPVSSSEGTEGFRALKGHAALSQSADVTKSLEDARKNIAGGLTNDRQQQLFLSRTQSEMLGAQRQVEQHTFEQDQYVKDEAFKTSIRTTALSAVNAYSDPLERQRQIETSRPWLELEAERQGLRGRDAEVFVEKYQGAVAEQVLQRIMADDGRSSDALAFFEQNRQKIGPDAHKYEAQLKRLSTVENATDEVKRIEQQYFDDPAAQEKAVAGLSGEMGAKALDIFRERLGARESAQRAADNATLGTVVDNIEAKRVQNSGQLEHDPAFNKLSDEGKGKAREHLRLMQNSVRINDAEWRRQQREADLAMLHDFQAVPLEDRVKLDLNQRYAGVASPNGMNLIKAEMLKAKKEFAKDGGVKEMEFDRLVQTEAQGILPDKQDMDEFKGVLRRLRSDWMVAPGNTDKPLPREEAMKWITQQLTRKDVPWGFDKFAYRLSPEDNKKYGNTSEQPYWQQRLAQPNEAPGSAPQDPATSAPSVPTRKQATATSEIPTEVLTRIKSDYDGWRAQHPNKPPVSDAMLLRAYNDGLASGAW
jgi:hypothetical protein